jgi:hypothetical protein
MDTRSPTRKAISIAGAVTLLGAGAVWLWADLFDD